MDPRTAEFTAFCVFNAICLAVGYVARRRGLLGEHTARPIHFVTVSFVWGAVALLSLWRLPPEHTNLWLLVIEPLLVAVPAFAVVPIARRMGCDNKQVGVLATAAGLGNLGFTLGAYLCYTLLDGSEGEGDTALAYAVAQVNLMAMAGVVMLYPLARHLGGDQRGGRSVVRLIVTSFFDLRALMVHCAIVGVVLAYMRVPYPVVLDDYYVVHVLFYLGGFGGYFGIGLRLRLGDTRKHLREHALLAAVKFVGIPLLSFGILAMVNLTGAPLAALGQRVVMVEAFMPVAIQGVMIANLFRLDGRMASTIWLVNTVIFVLIPLPLLVFWLG
jgi:predicted permease